MGRNNYFQFKQFKIVQDNAAMKVGTDGVLLGAWANVQNATSILDIGTGTGLVALMMAQRSEATIDAIDIEVGAVKDAELNFKNSKWADRLNIIHSSLQQFADISTTKYNCIVCNPPFFTNGVRSTNTERLAARHTDGLSFNELILGVSKILDEKGSFNVIIPADTELEFRRTANQYRLFASKIVRIKPKPSKALKRVLIEFSFESIIASETELILETDTHHEYTLETKALFADYYLKL